MIFLCKICTQFIIENTESLQYKLKNLYKNVMNEQNYINLYDCSLFFFPQFMITEQNFNFRKYKIKNQKYKSTKNY